MGIWACNRLHGQALVSDDAAANRAYAACILARLKDCTGVKAMVAYDVR